MKIRLAILTCVGLAVLCLSLSNLRAEVTFDWAIVGNPGNAGDVQSQGTFGAVANTYRISKDRPGNNFSNFSCRRREPQCSSIRIDIHRIE
jgi:hypothetical protein